MAQAMLPGQDGEELPLLCASSPASPAPSARVSTVAAPPKKKAKTDHAAAPFKGSFLPLLDPHVEPHTLILGTQPGDNSLGHGRYFMTNTNAFWHIVGDAFGFRRGFWTGERTTAPPSIASQLMHPTSATVDYDEATRRLTSNGYALWDFLASSKRKGSLDSDIKEPVYADVRGFVEAHPSIRKICFATGKASAELFRKGQVNKSWLATPGAFAVQSGDALADSVFAKALPSAGASPALAGATAAAGPIELVILESVSPAYVPRVAWNSAAQQAAGYDDEYSRAPVPLSAYAWKRDSWLARCFGQDATVGVLPEKPTRKERVKRTNLRI
jgi:G:T/U-mismatch repair DNA glycosylase